jgi:NADH dehydrogenase
VLISQALERAGVELVAAVRSERAASELPALPPERASVVRVDFEDSASLRAAFSGARSLVHLPGILIETATTSYRSANIDTVRAAVDAAKAAGVEKVVLVGGVGADLKSTNPYFKSKAKGERIVRESGLSYTVLRAPLVLGCRTEGVHAFVRETGQWIVPAVGGGHTLEQPLDARDLARAALNAACDLDCARDLVLDLVGPTALPMREIIARGAALRGRRSHALAIPAALVRAALGIKQRFAAGGLTPEVLDVMLTDVSCDPKPAAEALGIELTALDETLRESLALWGAL